MNNTTAARQALRAVFAPKGALTVTDDASGAVVYLYAAGEKFLAMAFTKSAGRPSFHYSFRNEIARETYVAEWLKSQAARAARSAERSAARKAFVPSLKVGDILYSTWGYDQTNCDFYQVTEVAGKSVLVREIDSKLDTDGALAMTGRVVAARNAFKGEPMRKIVQEGNRLTLTSYSSASLWDGRPVSVSWYA